MEIHQTKHKVQLEKEQETLLITLYAKATDSQSKHPILYDKKAEEIVQLIDYDFDKIKNFGNKLMVLRAKQFDVWLKDFLNTHSDVTVLNLGCGLDTRISRVDPPSTVRWFDLDFPEVIKIRKLFYSTQEGYEMISSSVTDFNWLENIPKDKPVMILAEGILEYLTEVDVQALLTRLTNDFPYGQMAFDVMNSFAINSGKKNLKEKTGAEHKWVVDDLHNVDKLNSTMKRIADLSLLKSEYKTQLPLKTRLLYTALSTIPSFRNMLRVLLYKF